LCKLGCMLRALVFLAACALALEASAQAFPAKPLRLVVGYPPGGSGDFLTRLIADEMSKDLGAVVIVDNRPGAGGNIAAELVARAPADGYTVLNGNNHAITGRFTDRFPMRTRISSRSPRSPPGRRSIVRQQQLARDEPERADRARQSQPWRAVQRRRGLRLGTAPRRGAVRIRRRGEFTSVQFDREAAGLAESLLDRRHPGNVPRLRRTVMGFVRSGRLRALARCAMRDGSPAVPRPGRSAEAGLPAYELHLLVRPSTCPRATPAPIVKRLYRCRR